MYEDQTYEALLERMLDRVPTGLDKREGSIIYDALAPAAAELAQMYVELDVNNNLYFADTATSDYLERCISWLGIVRREASRAQLKGIFYKGDGGFVDVPLGSRFSLDMLNYKAVEKLSPGVYRLECEAAGEVGNRYFGSLLPVDYIADLAHGEIASLLIPGEDSEADDSLRQRYLDSARRPVTSGNKYHYMEWAMQVAGVGGARIFPLWNGPKTVKVIIVDAEKKPASELLVAKVQEYIDPDSGTGEGQAPVGAIVTVASATGKSISISAQVTLASGYTFQAVSDDFKVVLESYRKEKAFSATYISQSVIGALLLATEGVVDYSELKLNGGVGNVMLNEEEVPLFGNVLLGV